jgi:hypothetical protein
MTCGAADKTQSFQAFYILVGFNERMALEQRYCKKA